MRVGGGRADWFVDLSTKTEMNSLAIGAIKEIMADTSTAESKVSEIALVLQGLNQAWCVNELAGVQG